MKPKVIYSDKFLNSISWFSNILGISLFPYIILREKYEGTVRGEQIINHETIHFQQQLELLVIPFYILYILNYIFNGFNYRKIIFEQEAFNNENNLEYLTTRKRYSWIQLLKNK